LGGVKYFDFKRTTVFGFGHRLSKHKTTRYARNLGGMVIFTPLATPTLSAQALAKYKADFWFRIEAYYLD